MDETRLVIPTENRQRVYDSQMRGITRNIKILMDTRPDCANFFDNSFSEESLIQANPSFVRISDVTYKLPDANMDVAYQTATLLATNAKFDKAIELVTDVSTKKAGKLEEKIAPWKNAGGLNTRAYDPEVEGSLEAFDYFYLKTEYFASLFALNELKAHQAVRAPGFRWNEKKFTADLESAETTRNEIVEKNPTVAQYLELFLLEQIKRVDPNAVENVGIDPILPSARATLALTHLKMAAANPEYLEELILLDLKGLEENPIQPNAAPKLQAAKNAVVSLGLEKEKTRVK